MLHRFPKPHIYEAETESVDFGLWREPEEEEARRILAAQATGAAVQARMGRNLAAQATGEEDADVRRPKWRLGFPIQFCASRGIPPGNGESCARQSGRETHQAQNTPGRFDRMGPDSFEK